MRQGKRLVSMIIIITIGLLLSSCVNITGLLGSSDCDGKLFDGIKYENLEMIKEAIDDGADINKLKGIITPETNPLWLAYNHAQNNNLRVPEYLVKIGADVNYTTSEGSTYLLWAASNIDVHKCEFLIKHGAKIDIECNGYTALERVLNNNGRATATEKNIDTIVTMLLEHGAKIRPVTLKAALEGRSTYITPNLGVQKRILEGLIKEGYQSGLDPTLEAAMLGQSSKLIEFVKENKIKRDDEWKILFFTAAFGSVETIKLLELKGLDLSYTDKNKYTPLMIASYYGNLDVVKYLVSKGVNIQARDSSDNSALNFAVINGQLDTVEYLIKRGSNIKPFEPELGGEVNVLFDAAENGNVKIIQMILDHGFPVNDDVLWRAAQRACTKKNYEAFKFFLANGVDLYKKHDVYGDLFPVLSDLNDIKFFLDLGVNINGFRNEGDFLRGAISYGNAEAVEYLLKNGADMDDIDGYSALMTAISVGDFNIVKMLVEKGSNLEFQNEWNNRNTAIITAGENGSRNILEYVIKKGANINYQNNKGETALIRAVSCGWEDNVRVLVENKADMNLKDKDGRTAMDYAKNLKNKNIAKILSKVK
ncbi:MAG TPA: ankyrin repeat domain-containing protein [Pseudobacteroides sp.]|uniref:ankyrin repeat domain-containing protein n=1 Tax=Pseudobacteroides sp. TaxID=1968840 RepID=UPI002F91EA4B